MPEGNEYRAARGPVEIQWCAQRRIAVIRYAPDASLTGPDSAFVVSSLEGWIGDEGEPFSVLAFAHEVRATDAAYRATASAFYRKHRAAARIAMLNTSPVLTVVSEMFRDGVGVDLETFSDEAAAREWLATSRARP